MKLVGWLLNSPEVFSPTFTQVLFEPESGDFFFRQTRFDRETDLPYFYQERVEAWEVPSELCWRTAWIEWAPYPLEPPEAGSAGVVSVNEFLMLTLLGRANGTTEAWNQYIQGTRKTSPFPELRRPHKKASRLSRP